MKPCVFFHIVLLVGLAAPATAEQNVPPPGFTPLFNGRDLSGWYGWGTQDPTDLWKMTPEQRADYKRKSIEGGLVDGNGVDKGEQINAHWRVENGELVNDGKGLYLTTDKDYGDFELWVDYKMLPLGDSGIYLRGIPQVQIWDYTEEKKFPIGADKGSGGLWNNKNEEGKFPLKRMDKPFGEWNTFHIRMIGERVTVALNGEVVVANAPLENFFANKKAGFVAYGKKDDKATESAPKLPNGFMPDPAFPKGPIQLQTHGSEIHWRNVFVREIHADEANRELASRAADGFVEQVNGKDLGNWQGAVESYEMRDGAIVCKPGKGGDLLTKEPFENGTIRIEFKLPKAGNNGIALRTPLGGHSAGDGLELQIIDSDGYNEKQAARGGPGLEPYQYHGSLYHCVGAKHGYLRPVGEWNFQEIDVDGQKIKVTLNGTKILDVDIDTFDRSQIKHPPKGLDRRSGFIGLAGHSDPVQVRSFKVKRRGDLVAQVTAPQVDSTVVQPDRSTSPRGGERSVVSEHPGGERLAGEQGPRSTPHGEMSPDVEAGVVVVEPRITGRSCCGEVVVDRVNSGAVAVPCLDTYPGQHAPGAASQAVDVIQGHVGGQPVVVGNRRVERRILGMKSRRASRSPDRCDCPPGQ